MPLLSTIMLAFLSNIWKNYDKAEKYFRETISINPNQPRHLHNFGTFMETIRKKPEDGKKLHDQADDSERKGDSLHWSFSVGDLYEESRKLTKTQKRNLWQTISKIKKREENQSQSNEETVNHTLKKDRSKMKRKKDRKKSLEMEMTEEMLQMDWIMS